MAYPTTLTDDNFETEVLNSETPVLVDFYADWCGPCKTMAPVVEELAEEFDGRVKVGKLDVDANPETSATYGVRSIPTFIIFDGGRRVAQGVGALPKAALKRGLEDSITKVTAA